MLTEKELDGFLNRFLENEGGGSIEEKLDENWEKETMIREEYQIREEKGLFHRPLTKRTKLTLAVMAFFFLPTLVIGVRIFGDRKYLALSLILMGYAVLPFFVVFEGRKPKARELMVLAVLVSLAVAGRAAFFMLPQFKPVAAIVIISAVSLGPEAGFLVGAVTALVSNFFFGQGPWTPWQMTAFGAIGFFAGFLPKKKKTMCVYGFLAVFFLYGGIMNPASMLLFSAEATASGFLACYISGAPMDLIHAASTVIFLWLFANPMLEKLDRVKRKYGLCQNSDVDFSKELV